jgi:hypothetical protein
MRQRFTIIITIFVLTGILLALNAASYVRIEKTPDTELRPDRSTYNAGATGTRALFDFLNESGYRALRLRESSVVLSNKENASLSTFVVGQTIVPFEKEEAESLLRWVARGGRLVIIDRLSQARLLPPSGDWQITTELVQYPTVNVQSDDLEEMTAGVGPVRAAQPTRLTRDLDAVLPSRFASLIKLAATNKIEAASDEVPVKTSVEKNGRLSPAPVVHLQAKSGALLIDYPHGAGRIILLSDPFIVANSGINPADNLQLALNLVADNGGTIAFDEYHQGRGVARNELLAYFAGTPVIAIFAQAALLMAVVIWTHGRRFARPLPVPHIDRRSKLEFVASMAELQQRARAYDLAIENIYARTRRVLARYSGTDISAPYTEIAARLSARTALRHDDLESLMRDCEDAIAGAPINGRQALDLIARLREVENKLGLGMRERESRQVKEMLKM